MGYPSENVTINVNIAERNFELTIKKEDEAIIKKAEGMVNEQVAKLKESYQTHDKRDYLAMASLLFCVNQLKGEAENKELMEAEKQLTMIDHKLETFFNGD